VTNIFWRLTILTEFIYIIIEARWFQMYFTTKYLTIDSFILKTIEYKRIFFRTFFFY